MFKSVFKKYFSVLILVLCISFVFLAGIQTTFFARYWVKDKEALLIDNAKTVAEAISVNSHSADGTHYILEMDKHSTIPVVLNTLSKSMNSDIIVTDNRGVVLITSEQAGILPGASVSRDFINNFSSNQFFDFSTLGGLYEKNTYVAGVPYSKNETPLGYVFIASSSKNLSNYLFKNLSVYLLSVLGVFAISCLVVYIFTSRITKPLRDMASAAKKFGSGDFTARIPVEGKDEVAELALSLNEMAASLSEVESVSRNFIGDISHELRTPMTTISGFVDGILDETIPPEKCNYYLKIVSDEVHRLSRLVTAMLNMSRIDKQTLKLQPTQFDLTSLAEKTLFSFESRIQEKNIDITGLENCPECPLSADEDLLGQVLYNLIDNAVKFTNQNGVISLSVQHDISKCYFTIHNTGDGIPSEELRHIFDRFYKSDRSRGLDKTGAGLGLFIVKNVINMHHGEIIVRSKENEYTEFSFWLPLSQ